MTDAEFARWRTAFGLRVRAAREAAGMTQAEVARAVGIGKSAISQIEAGLKVPTMRTGMALAAALGEDLLSLIRLPAHGRAHTDDTST